MKKIIKVKAVKKEEKTVYIDTPFIKLDAFLKLCDIAQTGGHGKMIIQDGLVEVNGEVCVQRGKKIKPGDRVRYENTIYSVEEK
ncbi:MAG: RNA-binding S4 domain-containing protein [Clostridiales bacterium]|nr:RNA-binding S4 domain-containing protein [Clostridiales bacterium]